MLQRLPTRGTALAAALILAAAWLLVASSVALASLSVQLDPANPPVATESPTGSDGDGIIGPGDQFNLRVPVISSQLDSGGNPQTLTNVSGAVSSTDGSANVVTGSSAYPDLAFGVSTSNSNPFVLSVPSSASCGVSLPLSLQLNTAQGQQAIPFTIGTGAAGAFQPYNSTQVPVPIPSLGSAGSTVSVPQPGRVKGVRVRIGSITHPYDGDLQIDLISPDGTDVELFPSNLSNNGQNFSNTVFDSTASTPITSGSAPYAGSFKPVGDLNAFVGKQQQGLWQLKITAVSPGQTGLLNSWGADVSSAVCSANPTASLVASPNPAIPGATVSFDGSASRATSSSATITKYEWNPDTVNTPNAWTSTGSTSSWTHAFSARGQYSVGLRVTDSNGKTGQTTTTVSITQAPTAAFSVSPSSPVAASPVTFNAAASTHDPSGSIVDYRWDLDGSGRYATDTGNTPTATTTYATPRTVVVGLRVTDDAGATAATSQSVSIGDAPPSPSLSAPSIALIGQAVSLDASNSRDPDGTISDYRWDLSGGGSYATDTGTNPRTTATFSSPGSVTVGVKVTDNASLSATTTRSIQVVRPPSARVSATPSPATAGQQVTLDASGSASPDGVIADYRWDLDGSGQFAIDSGSTPFLQHVFPAGSHPVSVRVTDNYGHTATASVTVTVNPASSGGGGGGGTGLSPSADLTHPFGGNPSAGIASLTRGDLQTIIPGSDNHFASIGGDAVRRARAVAKGLWVNALSDRPASFQVSVAVSAADAQVLKLVKRPRRARHGKKAAPGPSTVNLGSGTLDLTSPGQKPFAISLSSRAVQAMRRARGGVKLLVTGTATDAAGHHTNLARVFLVSR